jgi:hypothetical protein
MWKLECALAALVQTGRRLSTMAADHARSWPWAGSFCNWGYLLGVPKTMWLHTKPLRPLWILKYGKDSATSDAAAVGISQSYGLVVSY